MTAGLGPVSDPRDLHNIIYTYDKMCSNVKYVLYYLFQFYFKLHLYNLYHFIYNKLCSKLDVKHSSLALNQSSPLINRCIIALTGLRDN